MREAVIRFPAPLPTRDDFQALSERDQRRWFIMMWFRALGFEAPTDDQAVEAMGISPDEWAGTKRRLGVQGYLDEDGEATWPSGSKAVAMAAKLPSLQSAEAIPYGEILRAWDRIMPPNLPRPRLTESLMRLLKPRWKDSKERGRLEWWEGYFSKAAASDFLCGRGSKWRVNLHWLLNPNNMDKVLAGNYEGSAPAAPDRTLRNLEVLGKWRGKN